MMNLFYRGYVIHEDVHDTCYTIYGQRPNRVELVIAGDSGEAMTWIDRQVVVDRVDAHREEQRIPWLSWVAQNAPIASAW